MPDDGSVKLVEKPYAGVATCPACDLHASATESNNAVDLYRRHANVTGHDVERERVVFDIDVKSDDMKTAPTELGEDHPDGVELGRLTAALADNGVAIGEMLNTACDLQVSGGTYEPQDDYIFTV